VTRPQFIDLPGLMFVIFAGVFLPSCIRRFDRCRSDLLESAEMAMISVVYLYFHSLISWLPAKDCTSEVYLTYDDMCLPFSPTWWKKSMERV